MKKIKQLLLVFVMMLIIPVFANASILETGDNIKSEGDYNSTKVFAGDNVENDGYVDGLGFLFGNIVKNEGKLSYGFLAGNEVSVSGEVEKDLYVAGNIVTIEDDAIIPRDVYVAGNEVVIKSHIGRTLYVASSTLDLRDVTIDGNVKASASEILVNENTVINGTLEYNEDASIANLDEATINDVTTYTTSEEQVSIKQQLFDTLLSGVSLYCTVLVILLIFKKLRDKIDSDEVTLDNVVKNMVVGLIGLIAIPLVSVIFMFTEVLMPLSFILLAIYFILIYLSFGFASYNIGRLIWKLTKKDHIWCLDLAIGIIVFELLCLIPYVSSFVATFALFYGLGYLISLAKNN